MSTDVSYIDISIVENLSQFLSPDKLESLLHRYIEDSNRLLEQLTISLAGNNTDDSRRHVHSLKSTSPNIGANPLAKIAAELEELARLGQLDKVVSRLDELQHLLRVTTGAIADLDIMQQQQIG